MAHVLEFKCNIYVKSIIFGKIIDKAIKEKVFPGAVVAFKYENNPSQFLFSETIFTRKP